MKNSLWALCIALTLGAAAPAEATEQEGATRAPWPAPAVGRFYGVQVKEGRTTDAELDKIKAAGFDTVRFVIPWYEVEKGRGRYVWGYFHRFVARLRDREMNAVIVLGGGHPDYTGRIKAPDGNMDHADYYLLAPKGSAEVEAFARFAAAAVEHFGTEGIVWELWNEPDSDRFWAPKADAHDYVALAQASCVAMRKAAPQARIVGPGMADTPGRYGTMMPGFLGALLQSPAATCLDAVSFHPYRDGEKPPETVLAAYEKARGFVAAYTPKTRVPLPIIATEWGFTTTDTDEQTQADFMLRSFLLGTLSGVPLTVWYEWRDARPGPDDPEAHFGLLTLEGEEKPAFAAAAAFFPKLAGMELDARLSVGRAQDFILSLRRPEDGRRALVFWTPCPEGAGFLRIESGARAQLVALGPRPAFVELDGPPRVTFVPPDAMTDETQKAQSHD